jgi:UDP-N-acetyl-D-glucosamine/UDP-N-acetyl-D-galactosamine dehydrogenase
MAITSQSFCKAPKIAVVGLGYVGLPLAVALAQNYQVVGFDVNVERVMGLQAGDDFTGEISRDILLGSSVALTSDTADLGSVDVFIVAVPTPVDEHNKPDLASLKSASKTVGGVLSAGAIVVFESTVYPGVTEEVCGAILEARSGLRSGQDFFLGYSPERINPGDKEHTVDRITKVVAGQTSVVAEQLEVIYGSINGGNIFVATDIRTAEAAKVIENAQRDINIAFINEIAIIFERMGLSTHDVLEAAGTKWNFLNFKPGLVGGHCIGIDPYYLAHSAEAVGLDPEIVLAGRRINDGLSAVIAARVDELCSKEARILVLGITFKENVPDIRNSKVVDLVRQLQQFGRQVDVFDPFANPIETEREYGIRPVDKPTGSYGCAVAAVAHDIFQAQMLYGLLSAGGVVVDIKGIWRHENWANGIRYWSF